MQNNMGLHASAMFELLHSSMDQELFKSISEIIVATMKNTVLQRKPSHATTKFTLFTVSKDKWRTLVSP